MGLKGLLRSPADHDLSTLFVLCQKTEWVGGWVGHGFTLFELLKLCSCQNDNGWLLMSRWKLFWSWQKIIIWSDLMASKSAISILVTICTHMYLQYVPNIYIYLQYVPIFMYNMYSYLYLRNSFDLNFSFWY